MRHVVCGMLRAGALAAALSAAGCRTQGVSVMVRPLAAFRQVPVTAVVERARLERHDFMLDAEKNVNRAVRPAQQIPWIRADRLGDLCREYFAEARLFQTVQVRRPADETDVYLVLRPRVSISQHIRPSVGGTVLTLGTGLIYTILGGSAYYRSAGCGLAVDVESSTGRPIGTYHSACRSGDRLVTAAAEQLGPLVSYAFTKAVEDVANQMSADNDLLMRALLAAKGADPCPPMPMRITIREPKGMIVREQQVRIRGQVMGVDRPVRLLWSVNGVPGGPVPLTGTSAASVKEFTFPAALPEGIAKVTLSVRARRAAAKDPPGAELARTVIPYLCVPRRKDLPEVRRRWAVVIGISDYAHDGKRWRDLKFAHRDAAAFRDFLLSPRSGGFAPERVMCLINEQATYAAVRHALFEFLAQAGREDLVVVFFSGHGVPSPGAGNASHTFIPCHDTLPDRLRSTGLPMWDIDRALREFVRAERKVVLADACHAGVIAESDGAKGEADNPVPQYLQQLALTEPGRLVFSASEARERSFEGTKFGNGHGVFTYYLLKGLAGAADADGNRVISAGEVIEYVRAHVINATNGDQHPSASGQFDRNLPLAIVPMAK